MWGFTKILVEVSCVLVRGYGQGHEALGWLRFEMPWLASCSRQLRHRLKSRDCLVYPSSYTILYFIYTALMVPYHLYHRDGFMDQCTRNEVMVYTINMVLWIMRRVCNELIHINWGHPSKWHSIANLDRVGPDQSPWRRYCLLGNSRDLYRVHA